VFAAATANECGPIHFSFRHRLPYVTTFPFDYEYLKVHGQHFFKRGRSPPSTERAQLSKNLKFFR
jgi:hypothetical protein